MIYIATIHWKIARWIPIQSRYIRKNIKSEYRLYAWLNDITSGPTDHFYHICREPVASHAVKLNILADMICQSSFSDNDILIFLDGDAFPIGDVESLINQKLRETQLLAIKRIENNGDLQPHPCFCATTVGFWKSINGDWKEGYRWLNRNHESVTDVGGNLYKQLIDRDVDWHPMLRSNKYNPHPVFFGIYDDVIYHHGAGFRNEVSRFDLFQHRIYSIEKTLSHLPLWLSEPLQRQLRKGIVQRNRSLSESIIERIENDPNFPIDFFSKKLI